jgi:hypothetical protein
VPVVALALVVLLAAAPGRLRLLVPLGLVAAAAAAAAPTLLDVRPAAQAGSPHGALDDAATVLAAVFVVLLGVGAAYAAADARLRIATPSRRWANRALVALAAAGVVVVLVAGHPGRRAGDAVDSFKTPDYASLESQSSRFTGDLGSNRYDYWRAALHTWTEHPVLGVGADGFGPAYLLDRRSDATPRYAHSIWLETLATLGLPGLLALLAFAAAVLVTLARALARRPDWLVLGAAIPVVVVLAHGTIDWVTFFPVLTAPAVALAAAALGVAEPARVARRVTIPRLAWAPVTAAIVLLTIPTLISARLVERAYRGWQTRGDAALADLHDAARWNPLAARPVLGEAVIALELRQPARARDAFARANKRDGAAWYSPLMLGVLDAGAGERARAIRLVRRAERRNPRDRRLPALERRIAAGRPLDALSVQHAILTPD